MTLLTWHKDKTLTGDDTGLVVLSTLNPDGRLRLRMTVTVGRIAEAYQLLDKEYDKLELQTDIGDTPIAVYIKKELFGEPS